MFGFLKLGGAPPMAYRYYRTTKDTNEKAILEDLHKAYGEFIKKEEAETNRLHKLLKINGVRSYDDYEYRKMVILSLSITDLYKYGNDKGYSEFLISLFNQRII